MKLTIDELKEVINCANPLSPIKNVLFDIDVLGNQHIRIRCAIHSEVGQCWSAAETNIGELDRSALNNIKQTLFEECISYISPKFTTYNLIKRLANLNIK